MIVPSNAPGKRQQIAAARTLLHHLGFGERQSNELSALVLLTLAGLAPKRAWASASAPLLGITPIIDSIAENFGTRYAPNTRETIRDEAVKFFTEAGLLLRNPDRPDRPTNSGLTVYQLEPSALTLLQRYGTPEFPALLTRYLASRAALLAEIHRHRRSVRVTAKLSDGRDLSLSAGGQNPLIKSVLEHFLPIFIPGGIVLYVGDTETKFLHLDTPSLAKLGVTLDAAAKMPDVVIHDVRRNWLVLVEAVTSTGWVDGKRRMELKELFRESTAGLVFVTAFATRRAMQTHIGLLSWETEVWIAEFPEHMIHLNGSRFLGPYPDVLPRS
jgi:hypothetical protein